MIVFTLKMPHRGSWNGRWSGENKIYARVRPNNTVPKEVVGRDFYYNWDDGWCACVSVTKVDSKEAAKIRNKSSGFCGYDWMIESIIKNGKIIAEGK